MIFLVNFKTTLHSFSKQKKRRFINLIFSFKKYTLIIITVIINVSATTNITSLLSPPSPSTHCHCCHYNPIVFSTTTIITPSSPIPPFHYHCYHHIVIIVVVVTVTIVIISSSLSLLSSPLFHTETR